MKLPNWKKKQAAQFCVLTYANHTNSTTIRRVQSLITYSYLCVFGLSELVNCCRMKPPGVLLAICSAFAMAPFMPGGR